MAIKKYRFERKFSRTGVQLLVLSCFIVPEVFGKDRSPVFDFELTDNIYAVTNRFVLRNDSLEALRIADVRTTCGCAVAMSERRLVRPAETVGVDCVLDLHGMEGRVAKKFWVKLEKAEKGVAESPVPNNGGEEARQTESVVAVTGPGELALEMVGEARERIGLHPPSVFFSAVRRGSAEQTLPVLVRGYLTEAVVTGFVSCFTGRVFRVAAGADGRSLAVTLPGSLADGFYRETWQVATSDPMTPELPLVVMAQVRGSVWAVPDHIEVKPGDGPVACFLLLKAEPGAQEFRVEKVTAEPAAFGEVSVTSRPGGSWRIDVRNIAPDRLPDKAELVIRTTHPECAELRVPVVRMRKET